MDLKPGICGGGDVPQFSVRGAERPATFQGGVVTSRCAPIRRAAMALFAVAVSVGAVQAPASTGDSGVAESMPAMSGAFGSYPMTREASGTSWQPDTSVHAGRHVMSGEWTFMGHAVLNGVYDWQGSARGGEKSFLSGML